NAAAQATAAVKRSPTREFKPVLWVDDHPENNIQERHALDALGIRVDLAASTAQALSLIDSNHYGLIITDLGRDEDGVRKDDAGLELIQQLRARGDTTPIAVYAAMRAFQRSSELRAAGATQVFNRATDLITFVAQTLA